MHKRRGKRNTQKMGLNSLSVMIMTELSQALIISWKALEFNANTALISSCQWKHIKRTLKVSIKNKYIVVLRLI